MHLLESDSANESTENVHAFDIIAANGPLRRRGAGKGGGWPVDRHASVSRGIRKPLVNTRFARHVLTHRHSLNFSNLRFWFSSRRISSFLSACEEIQNA